MYRYLFFFLAGPMVTAKSNSTIDTTITTSILLLLLVGSYIIYIMLSIVKLHTFINYDFLIYKNNSRFTQTFINIEKYYNKNNDYINKTKRRKFLSYNLKQTEKHLKTKRKSNCLNNADINCNNIEKKKKQPSDENY